MFEGPLAAATSYPGYREPSELVQKIEKLERDCQKATNELECIRATLAVNFGKDGRGVDGIRKDYSSMSTHDFMVSVLREYVDRKPAEVQAVEKPPCDSRLYRLLDQLRADICTFRDGLEKPRLQSSVDALDRMAGIANQAVGIVIGTEQ